ncbi:MAG: redoxin domain-containing protein [Opitutales bacterium]
MKARPLKTSLFLVLLVFTCIFNIAGFALEPGDPAPDFLLPGTDGKSYALASFAKSKILVVVFTCNHCPISQAYEDRLIELSRSYDKSSLAIVAISPNDPLALRKDELGYSEVGDTLAGMQIRADRKGFSFPYLYDGADQNCSRAYKPRVTPQVFLFDQDRRLRYSGRIDNSVDSLKVYQRDLRSAIDRVLAGKSIRNSNTKVFGCPVKWAVSRKLVAKDNARLDRETVSLKSLDEQSLAFLVANKSKLLKLFVVWSPTQKSVDEAFTQLVEIHRRYRKRGLEIVTLTAKEPLGEKNILAFLQGHHASFRNYFHELDFARFPLLVDIKSEASYPLAFLIEPGGGIRYRQIGSMQPLTMKRAILEILGRDYSP